MELKTRPKAMVSPVLFNKQDNGDTMVAVVLDFEGDDIMLAIEAVAKQLKQEVTND